MGLNIKNADVERMARELASLTEENLTQAIAGALRQRLEQLQAQRQSTDHHRKTRILQLSKGLRKRVKEPWLSTLHGDILYDERGLPQ